MVSFVRSNAEGTVGHLLRDWRRLNVALSRAKSKLILVGSLRTLSSCAILSSLASILKTREWVYRLPSGAHLFYPRGLVEHESDFGEGNYLERKPGPGGSGPTGEDAQVRSSSNAVALPRGRRSGGVGGDVGMKGGGHIGNDGRVAGGVGGAFAARGKGRRSAD